MKRTAFISDIIFTFLTASILTLCLFRFSGVSLWIAIALAIVCGVLTSAAIGAYLQSKRKTYFLKKSDEAQKERLLMHLACLSDEGKTKFFMERLTDKPLKRFGRLRLYTPDTFYFLRFSFAPVTSDELLPCSRLKTGKQKILLCSKIEDSAYALAEKFHIEVFTGEKVYTLLKERDALPERYSTEESKQQVRKRRLQLCCAKSNAKHFLTAALLCLITSILSPFPYYYFLCGGILLLIAVLIRIFGYKSP